MKQIYRYLLIAILSTTAISQCFAQVSSEQVAKDVGFDQKLGSSVPLDTVFTDDAGKTVKLKDYFNGKPVVLVLAYYECPALCSEVLNATAMALRMIKLKMGQDYEVVTISIDPGETYELASQKKKNYVASFGNPIAKDYWHFLTGKEEMIKPVADAVGFRYVYDAKYDQYAHAAGITILTPDGKVSKVLLGLQYKPEDVLQALTDAQKGLIGSQVPQTILFCLVYDPATGKYSLEIIRLIQLASIIGVIILATAITVNVVKEKKRLKNEKRQSAE